MVTTGPINESQVTGSSSYIVGHHSNVLTKQTSSPYTVRINVEAEKLGKYTASY